MGALLHNVQAKATSDADFFDPLALIAGWIGEITYVLILSVNIYSCHTYYRYDPTTYKYVLSRILIT